MEESWVNAAVACSCCYEPQWHDSCKQNESWTKLIWPRGIIFCMQVVTEEPLWLTDRKGEININSNTEHFYLIDLTKTNYSSYICLYLVQRTLEKTHESICLAYVPIMCFLSGWNNVHGITLLLHSKQDQWWVLSVNEFSSQQLQNFNMVTQMHRVVHLSEFQENVFVMFGLW